VWRGVFVLLSFDVSGELLARAGGVALPGPVLGMAGLLAWLLFRGKSPDGLDPVADFLLRHLSLFFVPATVGALYLVATLAREAVAILVALSVSTLVGLVVAGWVFERVDKRGASEEREESP
jgi:holin-like protein